MQDDDAYTRESWIEVEARNRSGKCVSCKNAMFIPITYGKAYYCSRRLIIKDNCDMYQEGTPRDGRFSLTSSVNLKEIRSGIGTLENQTE